MFKVSLGPVWRRIVVRAKHSLDDLAVWILNAFDFDHDHLYQFTFKDRFGVTVRADHPYSSDELSADQVLIGVLPLRTGQSMPFLYDFGDNWEFEVKLERIDPPNATLRHPEILEAEGEAPPQYDWSDEEEWDEPEEPDEH